MRDRRLPFAVGVLLLFVAFGRPAWGQHTADPCAGDGPIKAPCVMVVFDGDSISAGIGASLAGRPDRQFAEAVDIPVHIRNVAAGGRPVHECLRLFPNLVGPLFATEAAANLIVFHAGDNDIAQRKTAAETYAAFTRYIADAHRQGWRVLVSTELQRVDFAPPLQPELAAYNRLLLANAAGADAVVDLDADRRFADLSRRNDPAVFSGDRIHPNDGGYAVLARLLVDSARPLLAR